MRPRIALAAALAAAPSPLAWSVPMSPTEANKAAVRRLYEACINLDQSDGYAELIAPDLAQADGSRGPAAFAANVDALRAGFPDIRFTIEDLVAEGDRVAVRWTKTGTHTGTFRGLSATGRAVRTTGIVIYRFTNGRAVAASLETDRLGALQQIGAIPMDVSGLARR
jgi:predicted ester cyclase